MKNIIIIFNLFLTIIWSQSSSSNFDISIKNAQTEEGVIRHLTRAETWYWLARATNNSLEYHKYADNEYQLAKKLAQSLQTDEQKNKYISTAEAGSEQTYWRKINAWNSFRNIFPAAWWYSLEDETLDFQDEDHLMLALSGCWDQLEPGILRQLTPKMFVVPRCNDSEIFEQSTDCGEIKDEFLNTLDGNPRFLGVRDDAVAAAIGPEWKKFINGNELQIEYGKAIGKFLKTDNIIVVDIIVIDEFQTPLIGGRIDMEFYHWDIQNNTIINAGNESGVVVSLRDRRWMVPAWIGFLLVIALFFAHYQTDTTGLSVPEQKTYILIYSIFFFGGFILSNLGGQLTRQFIPDWGAMALNTDHIFPLTEMWLWAFLHGALVMVGPIILCAYFILRFKNRVSFLEDKDLDISTILFTIQAGALGALFFPIIISWHEMGLQLAVILTAAALILSVSISHSFAVLMGTSVQVEHESPGVAFSIGITALLCVVPFGFFRPEWGSDWPQYLTLAMAGITGFALKKKTSQKKVLKKDQDFIIGRTDGSIDHPIWVQHKGLTTIDQLVKECKTAGVHTFIVGDEQGIGKTRFMNEIHHHLSESNQPWKIGSADCENPGANNAAEPYQVITTAFGPVLGISSLADRQATLEKVSDLLSGLEGQLTDLPGVGSLFDVGDEDIQATSKNQIIRDVTVAVRNQAKNMPLAFFLDNLQWSDSSSLDLLNSLIEKLGNDQNTLENPIVFVMAANMDPSIEYLFNEETPDNPFPRTILNINSFTDNNINTFLENAGVSEFSSDFGKNIIGYLGTGNPQHVLEFLRGLIQAGKAELDADGTLSLPLSLSQEDLRSAVPKELNAQIQQRISNLAEDDIMILEAAAHIGRVFSIHLLSVGLNMDRLSLLRKLRKIEDDSHLVIDTDKSDDNMTLESEALRNNLYDRATKKSSKENREIFKEFHSSIVHHLVEMDEQYPAVQVMNHALKAGDRMKRNAMLFGLKAMNESIQKFAWVETLDVINKLETAELHETGDHSSNHQITYGKAKALRGIGGQHQDVRDLLEPILSSPHIPSFDLFYTYLENEYNVREFEFLVKQINTLEKKGPYQDPLVAALAQFYKIISTKLPNLEIIALLEPLQTELKNITVSENDIRNRDSLLSMVIQESALKLAFSGEENIHEKVIQLFDESLALKEKIGDLQGIAINLGVRGSYNLYTRKDYSQAENYLNQDLELVEKMGDDGARSGIMNKLASCYWEQSLLNKDETASIELKRSAFDFAFEAFKIADHLELVGDIVFSGMNVFRYATPLGELTFVDTVGKKMNEPDLWAQIHNPNLKKQLSDAIIESENFWDSWEWISPLKALLSPDGKST